MLPIKAVRELISERHETVQSISDVIVRSVNFFLYAVIKCLTLMNKITYFVEIKKQNKNLPLTDETLHSNLVVHN